MMTTTIKASKTRHKVGTLVWGLVVLVGGLVFYLIHREQTAVIEQRHAQAVLAYTFDQTNAAVITLDKSGNIVTATMGVEKLTGYKPEELIGSSPEMLMPVAYREAHRQGYLRVMSGHTPSQHQIYCHIRRKDGENIVVLNHVFGYEGGGIAIMSPAPLSEAHSRLYRTGLEAANIGVWWWEIDTDRLVWDNTMFRLFAIPEDQWTPSYAGFERWVHADDRGWLKAVITESIDSGKPYRAVFRVNRPDGKLVYVRAYGRVFEHASLRVFAGINVLVSKDEYTGQGELLPW